MADPSPEPAPKFVRNTNAPLAAEFARLLALRGWTRESKEWRKAWKDNLLEWVREDFASLFGRTEQNLKSWWKLCRMVGIDDPPGSVPECQKALKDVHVNIYDLVDACKSGDKPITFKDTEELAEYSVEEQKVFPLYAAAYNPFLKAFLRPLKMFEPLHKDESPKGDGSPKEGGLPKRSGKQRRRRRRKTGSGDSAVAVAGCDGTGSSGGGGGKRAPPAAGERAEARKRRRRLYWARRKAKAKAAKAKAKADAASEPKPPEPAEPTPVAIIAAP
ncbi:hypothetical protein C8Q77DRAFT_340349 [Trametes polyzona]|nr:hypothetical protein C8Q77DRAFT_340349 [Trametes polyzona]